MKELKNKIEQIFIENALEEAGLALKLSILSFVLSLVVITVLLIYLVLVK